MKAIKLRSYAAGATLIVFGAFLLMTKEAAAAGKTESWMISQAPPRIDGVEFSDNPTTPGMSYRMDKTTYELLHPYGIVSRTYTTKDGQFDAVLIASNSKNSFHDPRVCFSGSGYTLEGQKSIVISTKSRGDIPATFTGLAGRGGKQIAIFLYKGPDGFVGTTANLKWSMFKHELLDGKASDGVFYRFIQMDANATPEKLTKFAADFIDEANSASKGYY